MNAMRTRILFLLLCCALPLGARASGSYTARPPRPPTPKESATLDNEKYALGKKIFTGKAKLKAETDAPAAQQETKLKELAGKLPKSVKEADKLPGLAGKLSARDLEALEYYLTQRYKLN